MGVYLNPGSNRYMEALNSEIYIDKTEMILHLNTIVSTEHKYVSISRPRRFGKTMAANMLCAYYGKSEDNYALFKERKLSGCSGWDKYLGKFDVIRLNMLDFLFDSGDVEDMIHYLTEEVSEELLEAYPSVVLSERRSLNHVMSKIYARQQTKFVIVIDEWDAVFREYQEDKEGQRRYLDFLRNWMKDKDYIALAYMTGILPIKKYGKHSALNMFDEYSMISPMQLASYAGFTEAEVKTLCDSYEMSYDEISDWYDGYLLSDQIPIEQRKMYRQGQYEENRIYIYSPLSVVKAVRTGLIRNYWNQTETYEALEEYIRRNYDGLKEDVIVLMDGGRIKVDISSYQNDMTTINSKDDIFTLLIHLGYLAYDFEKKEVFIPNKEILDEFKACTKGNEWKVTFRLLSNSQKLLEATWKGDEEEVAWLIEKAHNTSANVSYHSEAALSYAIQLAYYRAQDYYTLIPELDSGKGYVDLAYIPSPEYSDKPVLLVELKYEKNADTAIEQIKRQRYPDRLEHYKGNIIMVGIGYDKEVSNDREEFKHHSCKIERA